MILGAAASDPDETAAVLHGVLLEPIAPTIDQRRAITAPTLVLGHGIDLIRSFADARRLARQLPDARLIRPRTASGRMTNRGTGTKSHEVAEARWWRSAAARSSDRPDSMPRASTSRSGFAAKSPVIPKVTVPS